MPSTSDEPKRRARWIRLCVALISVLTSILLRAVLGAPRVRGDPLLRCGIDAVDRMRGTDFEAYLGLLFQHSGYRVERTPIRGDFGADLILRKGRESIAVQAKRSRAGVGVSAVQEIAAARNHYGTDQAWVVTNSYFTKPACSLARSNRVVLVDRDGLRRLMERAQPVRSPIGFLASRIE